MSRRTAHSRTLWCGTRNALAEGEEDVSELGMALDLEDATWRAMGGLWA